MAVNFKDLIKERTEKKLAISSISGAGFKNVLRIIFLMVAAAFILSCNQNESAKTNKKPVHKTNVIRKQITIVIQPFVDISSANLAQVTRELRKCYKKIVVKTPIEFPRTSLNQARTRHRADSLIRYLSNRTKVGYLTIGLTTKDISTTEGEYKDWGVMGLG